MGLETGTEEGDLADLAAQDQGHSGSVPETRFQAQVAKNCISGLPG